MKKTLSILILIIFITGAVISASASAQQDAIKQDIITVNISVFSRLDNSYILSPKQVEIRKGENVIDLLLKVPSLDVDYLGSGYVKSINGLSEFQHGPNSGWIFRINGVNSNVSALNYQPKNSDLIEWFYLVNRSSFEPTKATELTNGTQTQALTTGEINNTRKTVNDPRITATTSMVSTVETDASQAYTTKAKTQAEAFIDTAQVTEQQTISNSQIILNSLNFIKKNPTNFTPLVLSLYSKPVPKALKNGLIEYAKSKNLNITDLERLIINLSAVGEDVTNIEGVNLCRKLYNSDNILSTGLNGAIFALMTISHSTLIGDEKYNEDNLINLILQNQKADGGFSLTFDMDSDVDITALAVTSLSVYQDRDEVSPVIALALNWLSEHQNKDGSFSNYKEANTESTAQVLVAISSLGLDVDDERFVKDDNIYNALFSFSEEEGFKHTADGKVDALATEQALLAIKAHNELSNPYTVQITDHIEDVNLKLIIFISILVIVVAGIALYFLTRKRTKTFSKGKN